MLYSIFCYHAEEELETWTPQHDAEVIGRLVRIQEPVAAAKRLGPVARLQPTSTAKTIRNTGGEPFVTDGPFAETKEALLGFYVVDCENIDEAVAFGKKLSAEHGTGALEVRPLLMMRPGTLPA